MQIYTRIQTTLEVQTCRIKVCGTMHRGQIRVEEERRRGIACEKIIIVLSADCCRHKQNARHNANINWDYSP